MNRLFVDVGNSKLKWRLYIAGSREHNKCGSHEEFCAYLGEVSLEKPAIDSVKISSVKNNATTRAISDLIATKLRAVVGLVLLLWSVLTPRGRLPSYI